MPQEQSTLSMGTLLRERYAVEKVLGAGNTGAVYLVKDLQRKSLRPPLFALKEISGLDQQARHQFPFRGVALRQLQHPALPQIHHIFNDAKRQCVYLVADYVEGADLETLRQQLPQGRFSWRELRPLIEPLTDVLTYLHSQEPPLVHGDVKPTNGIKNGHGTILLVDMGSAQAASPERLPQTRPNDLALYQAPESFGGTLGPAADIYSLGATLYALLTGKAPTDALTRQSQVHDQKPDPLPLASEIGADIPRPLAQVLQQALALEPGNRFVSVKAFWEALPTLPAQEGAVVPAFSKLTADERRASSDRGKEARRPQHKAPLLREALLGALLLLLLSAGVWAWVTSSGHATISTTARQGSPSTPSMPGRPQLTSQATIPAFPPTLSGYPSLSGAYDGDLQPVFPPPTSGTTIHFTLHIQYQEQQKISGSFTAASSKNGRLIDDHFTGMVTLSGEVQFTVMDASGSAILAFTGRLTKSSSSSSPLGGHFHGCADEYGAICLTSKGPLSGYWTVQQT